MRYLFIIFAFKVAILLKRDLEDFIIMSLGSSFVKLVYSS